MYILLIRTLLVECLPQVHPVHLASLPSLHLYPFKMEPTSSKQNTFLQSITEKPHPLLTQSPPLLLHRHPL